MTRLLVARGTVLPFDAAFSVLEDHDVLVEGNRITAIAPAGTLEGPFDRVLWAGRFARAGLAPQVGQVLGLELGQVCQFAEQLPLEHAVWQRGPQRAGVAGHVGAAFRGGQVAALAGHLQ